MADSEKLWVIDLGEEVAVEAPPEQSWESRSTGMVPVKTVKPALRKAPRPAARPLKAPRIPLTGRLHFAVRLALTYLLGPLALPLWSGGRRSRAWTVAAAASGLILAALVWQWLPLLQLSRDGSLLLPVVMTAGLAVLAAFSCWAKALHLAFTSQTRSHTSWPQWMRSGWGVTGLGLIAPGLGLYLTGAKKRAVAAVWGFWPVALAAFLLWRAGDTWQWLQGSAHTAGQRDLFEYLLAGAAATLVLGYLAWLSQALSGLHLKTQLAGATSGVHGDRYAMALLVAVVAITVLSTPADLASVVHEASLSLDQAGFQVIPLKLARAAHQLDPTDTAYYGTLASLEWRRQGGAERPAGRLPAEPEVYYGALARKSRQAARPASGSSADSTGAQAGWSPAEGLDRPLKMHDRPDPL